MPKDTRDKNEYPFSRDIRDYLSEYSDKIKNALETIDIEINYAASLIKMTNDEGGRIFVGGNGGSAAISDHLTCDFTKGTASKNKNNLIVHSLNGQTALFTAIGNDLGYEKTLSYQLELARINEKDCVILISSSGNSRNIIDAATYAISQHATVIGLTGFDGGQLKKLATSPLHIPVNNYGIIEDCHQILMHVLAQWHWLYNDKT